MDYAVMSLVGVVCACIGGAIGFVIGKREGRRKSRPVKSLGNSSGWYDLPDGWRTIDLSSDAPTDPNKFYPTVR